MSNKEAIRKLLILLGAYKKTLIVIVACLLISTGLNLSIPLISSHIMDDGFIGGNKILLIQLVTCSLIIHILGCVIDLTKEKKRIDISAKIQYFLSEQSFSHLMKMQTSYFYNKNYAEILNNISVDIGNMTSIADEGMFFVITQAFSMTGGIIGLFILDYRMTILVLLFIPVKYIVMKKFASHRKRLMDGFILDSQEYAGWFGDAVGGIKEIKLFGLYDFKHKEFSDKQMRVIKAQTKMNMLGQWNNIIDIAMIHILTTIIYVVGANLVFDLQLSIGNVFAFITYSAYVTGPISAILNIGYFLSGIIPSTKRYYEFMDLPEEPDNFIAHTEAINGDIELEHVSFSYDDEKSVLSDVSLIIPMGCKIAFVGENGSGKSTIIDLILRIHEPMAGTIKLNGSSISDISLPSYRNMFSVVSQDIYIFNTSIRNNIALYMETADDAIYAVCEWSGLKEYIDEVSLDYQVGQNGSKLSGGQKQKIALARALLLDRPIVILDEATSSADNYSEQQINALLYTGLKDKTVIVVTHRMGILDEVDRVVRLSEGRIFEEHRS